MSKIHSDFDLAQFLPYQLVTVATEVSREFSRRYRREFGLTIPEWRVMANLLDAGEVSVRDIHMHASLDKPAVSRAARKLQEAGLVRKIVNAKDRRLVSLSLTSDGHDLMQKIIPMAFDYQAELIHRLETDRLAFERGLDRLTVKD